MCLLVAYSRTIGCVPLLLAGNRDELLARPAKAMERLSISPGILGGRDLAAGGTWMAVGAHGVVAALTNRPPASPSPRAAVRSRGELPLLAARHASARDGALALVQQIDPAAYNPCWMLIGDRESLFYLEVLHGTPLDARELGPGIHILENRPIDAASPKADHVRRLLPRQPRIGGRLLPALEAVLADRELPPSVDPARSWPPAAVEAASVRAGPYGTRWSGIVALGRSGRPRFLYADGPAGEAKFRLARW